MASIPQRFLRALEPIASMAWWAPESWEELSAVGVPDPWQAYFITRAAPLGRPAPEVIASAFYNWERQRVIDGVAAMAALDLDAVWDARVRGARRALERLIAEEDGSLPEVGDAVSILRDAIGACRPEGRTIFAALSGKPWPGDPVADLWHAADLLREYRGDGHIVVLVSHDVSPIEAILLHHLYVNPEKDTHLDTRGWSREEYEAARARLEARGFADAGGITDGGVKFRDMMEMETDRLAAAPFDVVGPQRCEAALSVLEPLAERIRERRGVPRSTATFYRDRTAGAQA